MKLFFIVFPLINFNFLYSQELNRELGIPVIKNYTPKEYGAHSQNWAIAQDKNGIMYFGNSNGLLEYDGVSWRLISVLNGAVRSLTISNETENGVIYIGGIDEFGYLAPDKNGTLEYKSLKKLLPKKEKNIGDVWSTVVNSEGIYFQTTSHLIRCSFCENEATVKLKIWKTNTFFNYAFVVDNQLYINEAKAGLNLLTNDTLRSRSKITSHFNILIVSFYQLKKRRNSPLLLTFFELIK